MLPPILSTPQKPHAWEPLSGLHGQITGEAEVEENISSLVLSWAEKKKQAYRLHPCPVRNYVVKGMSERL